jgi:hypothetical protein
MCANRARPQNCLATAAAPSASLDAPGWNGVLALAI